MNLANLLTATSVASDDKIIDGLRRRIVAYSATQPRDKDGKFARGGGEVKAPAVVPLRNGPTSIDDEEPQVTSKADAKLLTDAGFKVRNAGPVGNEDHESWKNTELGQITVRYVSGEDIKPLAMTPDFEHVDVLNVADAITKLKQRADERMHPHILPKRSYPEDTTDTTENDAAIANLLSDKAAKITLYHGTADDVEASILKEGFIPAKSPAGDVWIKDVMGFDIGRSREASAFATTDLKFAKKYSGIAAGVRHATPIVFKLEMPKDEFDKHFIEDEQMHSSGFRSTEPIPAKWITGVAKGQVTDPGVKDRYFMEMPTVELGQFRKIKAGDTKTVYLVFMADAAKDVAAYSPDQPRDKDGKWSKGGNEIFVSPNVQENLHISDALKQMQSDRQHRFEAKEREIVAAVAGAGKVESALGVWADGAENSTAVTLSTADGETLRYTAALLGKSGAQKAVLAFHNASDGPHALYTLSTGLEPTRIAADCLKLGIAFQTIIPGKNAGRIQILDQDGSLALKIQALGSMTGYTPVGVQRGTGEFIGSWTSREEGNAEYDKIIQAYEKGHSPYKGSLQFSRADSEQRRQHLRGRDSSTQKEVAAYSEDEARDKDGKWTTDSENGVKSTTNYAKHLPFLVHTDSTWRASLQKNMTDLLAKYAGQSSHLLNYDEDHINEWAVAYNELRANGDPENLSTLQTAAIGKGVYPEAAAAAGIVPFQLLQMQSDIKRWTGEPLESLGEGAAKVVSGADTVDAAYALEYAHTQVVLTQRLAARNLPTDHLRLYRGVSIGAGGFNNQVAAVKTLVANTPEWSVDFKTSAADSWTPDKYDGAYKFKDDGIVIGADIPIKEVWTSINSNPDAFSAYSEQEYIVAHPNRVIHLAKGKTEINAANTVEVLQAVSALRAAGWKVTITGKHILLEEPHPEVNVLHTRRTKKVQAKAHKLEDKMMYQGLPISIENKVGSTRSGVKEDGTPWSVVMPFDYGYIRGTVGQDGQHVDCFIGPDAEAKFAYVIHQTKQKSDEYDEDKVMLGFPSPNAAQKAYRSAYDDGRGLMQSMTTLPMRIFIDKVMKTRERKGSKKLHAGGQKVDIVAHTTMKAGGPGSGRHPEGGAPNREMIEAWLKEHGYTQSGNLKGLRGEHLWTRRTVEDTEEGPFDHANYKETNHSVMIFPDGAWSHSSDTSHGGMDPKRLFKVAAAPTPAPMVNRRVASTKLGQRILMPGTVVNQVPSTGLRQTGKGLAMLKLHMQRIGQE